MGARLATVATAVAVLAWPSGAFAGGSFESSDPLLDRIWASSVATARAMVTQPRDMPAGCPVRKGMKAILDGVERDRCVFTGDLAVTGKTLHVADGALPAVRDTLRLFAAEQHADGAIQPTTGRLGENILADYTGYWVEVLYDYVLFSGDVALARELLPNLSRALDRWYRGKTTKDGLVANEGRRNDYALIDRLDSFVAYYNAQHIRALDQAAALARWLGEPLHAMRWADRARALRPAVHAAFWHSAAGAYRDTLHGPLVHPQDGNAFAVLAGVASREQAVSALAYLSAHNEYGYGNSIADNDVWDGYPWGTQASRRVYPFISFFEVLARYEAHLDDSALNLIRRCWGYMVKNGPGTTWETIGPYGGGPVHHSWAHGWSSGAAPALTAWVLGVRPTRPGFETFVVDPRPAGLPWAKGKVPTPHGDLTVAWKLVEGKLHVSVAAPAGTRWENEEQVRWNAVVRSRVVPASTRLPLRSGAFGPVKALR